MSESRHNPQNTFPVHIWGCMAIAFTIPLAKKFVPIFITLLGLYLIYTSIKNKKLYFNQDSKVLFLLAGIFGTHLLGLTYSSHIEEGWNEIGIKASYLVFPLIGFMMPAIKTKEYENIIRSFVWGCLAFILFATTAGSIRAIQNDDLSFLAYEKLGYFIHPTYAATYQALVLFVLLRDAAVSNYFGNRKWIHILVCAVILIFISMLASKAGLIAAAISIIAGAYSWWMSLLTTLISK